MLCSFFGADFRTGEALTAGNTLRIAKGNNAAWAEIRPIKTDTGSIPVGLIGNRGGKVEAVALRPLVSKLYRVYQLSSQNDTAGLAAVKGVCV